uniref:Ycf55 n=2 Tax=Isochrysidaceae TaxID=418951 RepID=A0A3S6R2L2_9EUKA|nr:Ycf55 [Tisochrysis lutea]YP_009873567.1 hypothetical chloroplast RF55 [Isochrysis galbana]AUM82484.1 Ycf55 [Tisochrysis lutea]QKW88450.1 hypothetical chloroplast RF55 [Isochrysis galbana]
MEKKDNISLVQAELLFVKICYRLNSSLENQTNFLLGTDLLRTQIKQELFKTVALNVEKKFFGVLKENQPAVSVSQGKKILLEIVCDCTKIFLSRHYGTKIQLNSNAIKSTPYFIEISNDADILIAVPFSALINHEAQIFQSIFYPVYNSANLKLLETLFENLIIVITNCVMAIVASDFANVWAIRQTLYKSSFLSVRNSEQFKNTLALQNRIRVFIKRPKSLYNNEYNIFLIRANGIYCRSIYANRAEALFTLNKFPLFVINYIELQDFLVARSNGAFLLLGRSTQYFLTSVVGRVIGLIWKGVLDGLK